MLEPGSAFEVASRASAQTVVPTFTLCVCKTTKVRKNIDTDFFNYVRCTAVQWHSLSGIESLSKISLTHSWARLIISPLCTTHSHRPQQFPKVHTYSLTFCSFYVTLQNLASGQYVLFALPPGLSCAQSDPNDLIAICPV